MKKATTTMALCTALLFSANAIAADLKVDVTDIEEVSGNIMLAMYDNADGFDEGKTEPVHATAIPVDAETVTITIEDLAAGDYAIKLYHDANDNGEMDQNMMGLPIEGYGFSGNGGRFGPPAFSEAAFSVAEDQDNTVTIKLR
ncbi:MAG: DUF2141 domain-containing protein [Pseudomonadota bacterium]